LFPESLILQPSPPAYDGFPARLIFPRGFRVKAGRFPGPSRRWFFSDYWSQSFFFRFFRTPFCSRRLVSRVGPKVQGLPHWAFGRPLHNPVSAAYFLPLFPRHPSTVFFFLDWSSFLVDFTFPTFPNQFGGDEASPEVLLPLLYTRLSWNQSPPCILTFYFTIRHFRSPDVSCPFLTRQTNMNPSQAFSSELGVPFVIALLFAFLKTPTPTSFLEPLLV